MIHRHVKIALISAAALLAVPTIAQAQWWQHHPKYLHAMSDLRKAYWLVAHREENQPGEKHEERKALKEIGRAYQDLKDASIVDERDIADQPPADMDFGDHRGRLHRALDLLNEARNDIQGEEEDPAARGFRRGALKDLNKAIDATQDAIHAWQF